MKYKTRNWVFKQFVEDKIFYKEELDYLKTILFTKESKPKKEEECTNCQSDKENVAITLNNTCAECGRILDKNLRGIGEPIPPTPPVSEDKTFEQRLNDVVTGYCQNKVPWGDVMEVVKSQPVEPVSEDKTVEGKIEKIYSPDIKDIETIDDAKLQILVISCAVNKLIDRLNYLNLTPSHKADGK